MEILRLFGLNAGGGETPPQLGGGDNQWHQDFTVVKPPIIFAINDVRVFSSTLPTAGLVGMPGQLYQHHLSPTLSPLQSNGGEGARAFWTVVGFWWRMGILDGWQRI
jgi:hypothetical protein